ncbi:MAG: hypothetical protein M9951_07295, partial [Burkholderiaceae bacterium]|nr:hypothetical protein [Burkholderiaceae bacterium]
IEGANNWGSQGGALDPNCIACEGGTLSNLMNRIWGQNALAGFHDAMQVNSGHALTRDITNVPYMIPAALITYGAGVGQLMNMSPVPVHVHRPVREGGKNESKYRSSVLW